MPVRRCVLIGILWMCGTHASAGPYRAVEACFVLDTTGSMSGLIEAAKQKIWFIANEIVTAPSRPQVRLCLMGFRDRGDAYVTQHFDLTDDIDRIHAELLAFRADGGGDTPEAVNQALLETVERSSWSDRDDVLRLIFLVGDAPPHTDYDEPQYPEISERARRRGILINPVLCGADATARRDFQSIARLAGGRAAQLANPGRVERIATPMDQDLAALNLRLGRTLVPYGSAAQRDAVADKQALAEGMDDVGVSDRLAFNRATGRIVQGRGDLVDDLDAGRVRLAEVPREALPEAVRSMSEAELLAYLDSVRRQRDDLNRVVGRLIEQRRDWIAARRRDGRDGFDAVVGATIREQLEGARD